MGAYLEDDCHSNGETFFNMVVEELGDISTSVVALGRCHGSHSETVPEHCREAGGCSQLIGFDATQELLPFRFVLAFEAPANHPARCHMHVGGGDAAFLGFAAGAIPVYHGPHGAPEVFNREAVVIVDAFTSLREGLMRLRA